MRPDAGIAVAYARASETSGIPGILAGAFLLGMVPLPVLIARGWELAGLAVGLCYGLQLAPALVAGGVSGVVMSAAILVRLAALGRGPRVVRGFRPAIA